MLISSGAVWLAAPAHSAGTPAATTPASARQSGSIPWATLTPQQRGALDPLKKDWADLDGALLFRDDRFDGVRIIDGLICLDDQPGIGVQPRKQALDLPVAPG